ncbi:MAG TPA: pyridoxal-phosphate dependent enzyme, partial [Gemmatimonadaceae bacterium]
MNPKSSFSQSSRLSGEPVGETIPLIERFPALSIIPRVSLCILPSPVERIPLKDREAWIKREDLNAPACAGNKVRALEFLLGGLEPGDTVVTTGGAGSTHVLATAVHAARVGVSTIAGRWTHDMNPTAEIVARRITTEFPASRVSGNPIIALIQARMRSVRKTVRYIPIGGTSPLGMLGHVNSGLELADQITRREMPLPSALVVPLGSGGTAAGIAAGLAIAGLTSIEVIAARVGPRAFANRLRVMSLARRVSRFISSIAGERLPAVSRTQIRVVHHVYGGAYGRPLVRSRAAAELL